MGDKRSGSSAEEELPSLAGIDLSRPRYDQSKYAGRARHFFETVNPINTLVPKKKLSEAAELVKAHK